MTLTVCGLSVLPHLRTTKKKTLALHCGVWIFAFFSLFPTGNQQPYVAQKYTVLGLGSGNKPGLACPDPISHSLAEWTPRGQHPGAL